MSHLDTPFPNRIELGAVRREDWNTQVNTSDDGLEVRNNRWSTSLRSYDISLPLMLRTDADYIALRALFAEAEGSLHSFDFIDWSDGATVPVRFDTPLNITGHTPDHDHIDTFTLVEVRPAVEEGPGPIPDPPEYIASGTLVSQTSGTINVPYPAGLLADDVALVQVVVLDVINVGWNTPAGWALINTRTLNSNAHLLMALFYKRLTGSESGSQTFTTSAGGGSSTDNVTGIMSIFRGCHATGFPYDSTATSTAGNDTTPNAPGLDTFSDNRLLCNFRAIAGSPVGSNFQPGTGYTENYDQLGTGGSLIDCKVTLTSKVAPLPQSYGGETASIGGSLGQAQGTISVSLRP